MTEKEIKQEIEEIFDTESSFIKHEQELICDSDDETELLEDPLQDETPLERKRRLGRERKARFRARLNEKSLEKIRKTEAEKAAARRAAETPDQKEARRNANKLYQQKRRALETPEESEARKQADLQYHKNKFLTESVDQSERRKKRDLDRHKKRRARGSEKNYEEVYVRVFPSGKKEIIGLVDPDDSMFKC